jgi:hypothetical protein
MPPDGQAGASRPESAPLDQPTINHSASILPPEAPAETVADQLRRRREAALRLPPLASGKRDPWDIERRSASVIVLELELRKSA